MCPLGLGKFDAESSGPVIVGGAGLIRIVGYDNIACFHLRDIYFNMLLSFLGE